MRSATFEDISLELARRSFSEFLNYVYVEEPPPGRGAILFERWEHLETLVESLEEDRLIVVGKSRQIGVTWLYGAYSLWMAMYNRSSHIAIYSEGETEAIETIRRIKFIYSRLPAGLQVEPKSLDNQLIIEFQTNDSSIRGFSSTASKGRGFTFSMVWFDEYDRHPNAEEAYLSNKPPLDDVGGKMIITSTWDHRSLSSQYKTVYLNAPHNGFRKFFFPWHVRPNRDQAWYTARELEASDPWRFKKEYPNSEEEMMEPPEGLAAFDTMTLRSMEAAVRAPIESNGIWNIYQKYEVGRQYTAATDGSQGAGQDYGVTVIYDRGSGAIVADIINRYLSPEEMALHSVELLGKYGNPLWGIEENSWGVLIIRDAEMLGYPNLFRSQLAGRRRLARGWHTNTQTRFLAWGELMKAVSSRRLTIFSKDGLNQFWQVIRNPQKQGRVEAVEGGNDDYPMACAIAVYIAPQAVSRVSSLETEYGLSRGRRRRRGRNWV